MKEVIHILDEMVKKGVITDYAVGGATALMYFSRPLFTEDIDVFIYSEQTSKSPLIDLRTIYEYLSSTKNARVEGQYLVVAGYPLQFLVPYDELSREAFANAVRVQYGETQVKIFDLEYIMAIMIQLGKDKYRERLRLLLVQQKFHESKLLRILKKHHLAGKWIVLQKSVKG